MNVRSYARNAFAVVGLLGFAGSCYVERQTEAYRNGCPQIEEMASVHTGLEKIHQTTIENLSPADISVLLERRTDLEARITELKAVPCVANQERPYFTNVYVLMFAAGFAGAVVLRKDKKS